MKKIKYIARVVLAIVVAEAAMILLITLVQENIFGGISFTNSPWSDIILGGAGTFASAVMAGWLASLVMNDNSAIPHIIISVLVVLETTYLVSTGRTTDPLWFDIMAGSSLIVGIWLGRFIKINKGILPKVSATS